MVLEPTGPTGPARSGPGGRESPETERGPEPDVWHGLAVEIDLLPELGLLAAVLLGALVSIAYTVKTGTSPVPSSPAAIAAILSLAAGPLERRLSQERRALLVDLGAGWGGVSFALARRFPEARVVGYEVSPLPWLVARLRLLLRPTPNLRFERRDFLAAPLDGAALVTCYLGPGAMARLRPKLESELPSGCQVLSNTFAVPGWAAERIERVDDLYAFSVYRYDMPAARAPQAAPSAGDLPMLPFPP